jgi:predicted fused transcriptional regulator/phosphomethylpyrimidine kinase
MIKGFITFYVNFFPDLNQDIKQTLDMAANYNKETIEKIKEANYEVMFVPTTKEASRVEKVDFDKPHPRFIVGNNRDVEE